MSLEKLVAAAKWVDEEVQADYAKIKRYIPERQLYKVTTELGIGGATLFMGSMMWTISFMPLRISLACMVGSVACLDFFYNWESKRDNAKKQNSKGTIQINPKIEFNRRLNLTLRLPLLLSGAGLAGKAAYDVGCAYLESASFSEAAGYAGMGIGLVSMASSMYLKDCDVDGGKKSPNKAYDFLAQAYKKVRKPFSEEDPLPQPRFQTQSENLETYIS